MMRWLILAALVIVISATLTVAVQWLPTATSTADVVPFPAPPKPTGPVPKVVVDGDTTYEFGSKPQHEELPRDWVFWNKGEADLHLTKKGSTCSCTVANFEGGVSELTVKPNHSTKIHMTFNTREFNGDYSKGATIGTNDPARPDIQLYAHGEVHPALVFSPPDRTISFQTIPNDTKHRYRVAISSADRPDFKIVKAVSTSPDRIEAEVTPLTDEERKQWRVKEKEGGYLIQVTVKEGVSLGPFREELVIETDHPKQPETRLMVVGTSVGPITLSPGTLRATQISGKTGGKASVTLTVRGLRPTKFEVLKKPAAIEVSIDPNEKEGSYRLTATVPPGTPSENIHDLIVLKTDCPRAEVIEVPVTLFISN